THAFQACALNRSAISPVEGDFTRPRRRARRSLGRLLQLLEDAGFLEGGDVLLDLLALGDRAQQAPHDLAGARLRQVVAEADVLGLGDGTDLLAHPVAQFLRDGLGFVAGGPRSLQHDEAAHGFAGKLIRAPDHRRLRDELHVRHQRRLDFHGTQAVPRDVEYVVDAAHDAEVAVLVAARAVAREVVLALELVG